ncbi:hypothetical protein LCGC14_3117180, partial [marine sediment metagenome]
MQFTKDSIDAIKSGDKIHTRRPVKDGEMYAFINLNGGEWHQSEVRTAKGRLKWLAGNTYAIVPGRGKKSVGRIRITAIRRERLWDITEQDAIAEGLSQALDGKARRTAHGNFIDL